MFPLLILLTFVFSSKLNVRRRLLENPKVDFRVSKVLTAKDAPTTTDIILNINLGSGSNSASRCREAGKQLCDLLGWQSFSSLHCDDNDYNYIGPNVIGADSVFACFRYVYDLKSVEHEAIERIASVAERDDIKGVSQLDHEVKKETCLHQMDASWALTALDKFTLNSKPLDYYYNSLDGHDTVAYVIDSGIDPNHSDFEDRVIGGENLMRPGDSYTDLDGHGTAVASVIAGKTYGIAKQAKLYAYNVFGPHDTTDSRLIINAIQRAYERASVNREKAVINLSVGGSINSAEDAAANAAVANGVTMIVATGNDGGDSCEISPARAESVISVASHDSRSTWSTFNNYGSCVDIIAPGSNIRSAKHGTTDGSIVASGNSIAAPHVTGVVLQIMSRHGTSDPHTIRNYLIGDSATYSVQNRVQNVPANTVNIMLQSPCLSDGPVDECAYVTGLCRNGGTCVDLEVGFECACPDGTGGSLCLVQDECSSEPCFNGGTCVDLESGYECQCPSGYSGDNCETHSHPPEGCSCTTADHPSWGTIGAYCDNWGGNTIPFCYVTGDCDGVLSSRSVPGARWVLCLSVDTYESPVSQDPGSQNQVHEGLNRLHIRRTSTAFIPTLEPTALPTFQPTAIPTLQPTASPTIAFDPNVKVFICQYYSRFFRLRCCWKRMGQYDYQQLPNGNCPLNNQLRFIHVPKGVVATLFDGEEFNGLNRRQIGSGTYNIAPNWVSSMIVQPA